MMMIPIVVTLVGIVTDVNVAHRQKAPIPQREQGQSVDDKGDDDDGDDNTDGSNTSRNTNRRQS